MSYNPFAQYDLRVPTHFHDDISRFSRTFKTAGEKANPLDSPFERYVDVWMLAVCIGASEGRTIDLRGPAAHPFITGVVLASDPDRIELLELLAIGHTGNPYVITEPKRVIDLANGFAAAGMPTVIDMLRGTHSRPLWNITTQLVNRLEGPVAAAADVDEAG